MGKLKRSHMIETGVWLTICIIFFAFSFEFNQPIEIYKFGATGWPRVVLLLLLLATIGNFTICGHMARPFKGRVGIADEDESGTDYGDYGAVVKVIGVLGTAFVFTVLLKPVGFYFATPFFIALIGVLFGERRVKWVLGITAMIYTILLGLFLAVVLNAPLPQGNMSPFYDYSALILTLNTPAPAMW